MCRTGVGARGWHAVLVTPRLLHLNGPPGIRKSTLARRWAAEHPGTLCCDVDVLRTMIGGWEDDFAAAGGRIRSAALAFIGAYLADGQDVVLPQMLARVSELERFEAAATGVGAEFVTVMLHDQEDSAVARFHARGAVDADPWHDEVRRIVLAEGGDDAGTRGAEWGVGVKQPRARGCDGTRPSRRSAEASRGLVVAVPGTSRGARREHARSYD